MSGRTRDVAGRLLRRALGSTPGGHDVTARTLLAERFLHGEGIEIGALHRPLPVPADARVRYVDRLSNEELRAHYPELASEPLVEVDVIEDGELLSSFANASQDFVIANHFLEHCEDPIGALDSIMRVLRPNGVAYVAVPDKRYTFDRDRPLTPFEHLLDDHVHGPDASRRGHYEEWVRLVDKVDHVDAPAALACLETMRYSIHFHVWDAWTVLEFLDRARAHVAHEYSMECAMRNDEETILVVRRH